jgi:hypothetical protein
MRRSTTMLAALVATLVAMLALIPAGPAQAASPAVPATASATAGHLAQAQPLSPEDVVHPDAQWYFFAYYHDWLTCIYMGVIFSQAYGWISWRCTFIPYLNCYGLYYYAPASPAKATAREPVPAMVTTGRRTTG